MPLLSALACLLLAASLALLFWGNRLARFGFVAAAVFGTGLLAVAAGRAMDMTGWHLWLVGILAIGTACVLVSLLFRLWMGFSTMFFMGLLVSAMVVIWQGPPLPPLQHPTRAQVTQVAQAEPASAQAARQVWADNETALHQWWAQKPERGRHVLTLAMAIGAVLGLGLGLAVPMRAAALQMSAAGAGLLLVAVRLGSEQWLPDLARRLPETPRAILLVFLLLTALGFAAQSRESDAGAAAKSNDP